jgi:hypothetical protein
MLVAGEMYPLSVLCDECHPNVRNAPARVVQQNWHDIDGKPIHPNEVAVKLRPGTLVYAVVMPTCWIFANKDKTKIVCKVRCP